MAVVTRHEDQLRFSALMVARDVLERWVRRGESGEWPDASQAAVTLFLRAHDRAARGAVLAADRTHATITVDGTPTDVLLLSVPDGAWATAFRHADLTIIAGGRDVDPSSIRLGPIADPADALLGPEP